MNKEPKSLPNMDVRKKHAARAARALALGLVEVMEVTSEPKHCNKTFWLILLLALEDVHKAVLEQSKSVGALPPELRGKAVRNIRSVMEGINALSTLFPKDVECAEDIEKAAASMRKKHELILDIFEELQKLDELRNQSED